MIDEKRKRRLLIMELLDSLVVLKAAMADLTIISSAIAKNVTAIESNDENLNELIECLLIKAE
jgi:hypothetical protein